jgi:hypothetical protein
MNKMFPKVDIDKLLDMLDPSKKGIIVFFYLCEIILKHPDFKEEMKPIKK